MSERKNIDKLFQEKFKDFEAAPSEKMWLLIEEKLKEKKKRRVIPFWWKLSGIAATVLVGLLITKNLFEPKTNAKELQNVNTQIRSAAVGRSSEGNQSLSPIRSSKKVPKIATVENPIVVVSPHSKTKIPTFDQQQKLAENPTEIPNKRDYKNLKTTARFPKKNRVAINLSKITTQNQLKLLVTTRPSSKKNTFSNESIIKVTETKTNNIPYINQDFQSIVDQNKKDLKLSLDLPAQNEIPNTKFSLPMVDSEIKKTDKKIDSTAIATVVPNTLEELLKEKENNLVVKEPQLNRWQITTSIAPIYFGSTSNGSPIDASFSGNSKDYKTNLSIGLGVNYALTKKFTIRTSVNQVSFNYTTNDVLMYAGIQPNTLDNVNLSASSQFLHFAKKTSKATAQSDLNTDQFESYISQKMGFIEVPLELSYSLIEKKFGINIIGGISTLFLNENKIIVVSSGMTTNLGKANNLSKTHFSSNLGLGLKYRFLKKFKANFEPIFKYQINTFSKDSGNFKPYYFGLYTGLSYSF